MQLVAIPQNPVPPGAVLSYVPVDRLDLRVARWAAVPREARPCPGTVLIAPGRGEFIEKYAETVSDLLGRGFAVAVMDWRGQGGSSRLLGNRRKGHVGSFDEYARDLDAVVGAVLAPSCPRPWFLLAHSMGATVALHHAVRGGAFERMVLSAPMIEIHGLRSPRAVRAAAKTASLLGYGRAYIPGGTNRSLLTRRFDDNVLTSDPRRHALMMALAQAAPDFVNGAPTWGWLNAAFAAMAPLADPELPRRITTPILVVACGADRIVDTRATERFATRLKAGRVVVVPRAEHEPLMERDVFRDQFWAAFDAFVPGTRAVAPDLEPSSRATG